MDKFCNLFGFPFFQDIVLNAKQLDGEQEIPLKFVKFQNVQNIQMFVSDNLGGEEVTQIDFLGLMGYTIQVCRGLCRG